MALSPLNQRRWRNFRKNRRAYWSLWIFGVLFGLSLFAEFLAYDKPILIRYQGSFYAPIWNFYAETDFGGSADKLLPDCTCSCGGGVCLELERALETNCI